VGPFTKKVGERYRNGGCVYWLPKTTLRHGKSCSYINLRGSEHINPDMVQLSCTFPFYLRAEVGLSIHRMYQAVRCPYYGLPSSNQHTQHVYASFSPPLDRLRSFIQYDYSIGLRGLVGSRTASPPALYQIG
jgi:hypothetical protein